MKGWQFYLLCALAAAAAFLASLPDPWDHLPFADAPYREPALYERTAP